ncbi:Bcsdh7 [Apiospora saccharicola]
MRPSIRHLAQAASAAGGANALRPAPMMALLPPIPPIPPAAARAPETPPLGDAGPGRLIGFLTEWQLYAQKVEGEAWKGEKIDQAKVEKMSDQQIGQMYELMMAIKKQSEEDGQ